MTVYIIVPLCGVSDVIIKRIWGHVLSCISMYLGQDLQMGTKIGAEILVLWCISYTTISCSWTLCHSVH